MLKSRIGERIERFIYPKMAALLLKDATFAAKRNLRSKPQIRILVDTSVLELGTTHGTAWVDTKGSLWGGATVPSGYLARVLRYREGSKDHKHIEATYLPAIISLARQEVIRLCTSDLLEAERSWQPAGRFRGRGWFDYNVFNEVDLEFVDELSFLGIVLASKGSNPARNQVRARLDAIQDKRFRTLVDILGRAHSQDIWHLYSADRLGIDYYLTHDIEFMKACENKRKNPALDVMGTRMVTPSKLASLLGTKSVPLAVLSYQKSTWLVRTDIFLQD